MASHSQFTQIGKRRIELSNLPKVLFPEDHFLKAHLIEYYFKMAPTILAHLKGRPLSFVRYPDGIDRGSFFQKNRPEWAPDWIEHVPLGEEKKNYIIATEPAVLVWLANLACIELHQMHCRSPHFDKPDYIVYDLDPPEDAKFADVAALALEFKAHLESFGYHPFVKTTGRKGLHVLTPIEAKWEFGEVYEAAKAVGQRFVDSHARTTTLQIKKDRRDGKVLVDIYRNRTSQTIIAAYSVRGLAGAPVSTPLTWEELESLDSPKSFNLQTVPERVQQGADPWEAIAAYATPLHTERNAANRVERGIQSALPSSPSHNSNPAIARRTYKTPAQLEKYARKRTFHRTTEPRPAVPAIPTGQAFVLHRHHASRLHYDLRLERDGVLKSWAVPKGLPPRPGIKRLAVNVEDHPLEYVNFEGAIPKGEYGGGMMWKFAQGRHEITKEKQDGFYFRLQSPELNAEYRIHNTKENQWLLERVDAPQKDWLRERIEPMLAEAADKVPNPADYFFEVKWDGIRALIALDEGEVRIHGRNGLDMTAQFPELLLPDRSLRATGALFDGEIVCLEADGKPNFGNVIHRMQQRGETAIGRAKISHPAACYVFDCLYLDGRAVVNEPLVRRREWIADAIKEGSAFRVSQTIEDGQALLDAVKQMGLEGIMAKRRNSTYLPGKRSDTWLKIKTRQSMECLIIGYTEGKGDRAGTFGALHLAQRREGELKYVGKVGSGFDEHLLKALWAEILALTKAESGTAPPRAASAEILALTKIKRTAIKPADKSRSVWVEPRLACEVRYASLTPDGLMREPVFVRLRPDLAAD
ncbi:MAG: hypothetical protein C5B50_01115 [Verrucomicrobia bacterium]|nr:MAG: hypothetical protein C5B50_01115 [Verrucomicrobiota bacterium]